MKFFIDGAPLDHGIMVHFPFATRLNSDDRASTHLDIPLASDYLILLYLGVCSLTLETEMRRSNFENLDSKHCFAKRDYDDT